AGHVSKFDETSQADFPSLMLAYEIHPILHFVLTVVMLLIIYNTAVGMLYPFLSRFWVPYSRKYKVALVVSLIVGYIVSLVGLVDFVYVVYPLLGYVVVLCGIMILFVWMCRQYTR